MNMPDLNEARKRTKDKVNILYDEYKVPENVKNIGNGKSYALLTYGCPTLLVLWKIWDIQE